jgi:hypothetical protein
LNDFNYMKEGGTDIEINGKRAYDSWLKHAYDNNIKEILSSVGCGEFSKEWEKLCKKWIK